MSCQKTSNNKYSECPARMSDGRFCTDYRPSAYINGALKVSNNIKNSYEYRLFLQRNAETIFQLNNNLFFERNGSGSCSSPYDLGKIPSNVNEITCNKKSCDMSNIDENGVGLGINYNSDGTAVFKQPIVNDNRCRKSEDIFNQSNLHSS